MAKYEQVFRYVSGRGWITYSERRCPTCGQEVSGTSIEREVTKPELEFIVKPNLHRVQGGLLVVEIEESH